MKNNLPEHLLCEDPTSENGDLFIYHLPTRSLIHIVHTEASPYTDTDVKYLNRKHFDYTYKNNFGDIRKIMFVAEIVDSSNAIEQSVLVKCAHWYACYLGWEENCDDVSQKSLK